MIDWLLILLPGCIWGASFLFIAEGHERVAPLSLAGAAICMTGAWLLRRTVSAAQRDQLSFSVQNGPARVQ